MDSGLKYANLILALMFVPVVLASLGVLGEFFFPRFWLFRPRRDSTKGEIKPAPVKPL